MKWIKWNDQANTLNVVLTVTFNPIHNNDLFSFFIFEEDAGN